MKYFTLAEFAYFNTPVPVQFQPAVEKLVNKILDPIRENTDSPIYLNTHGQGWRPESVNFGKPNSQHKKGEAADIHSRAMNAFQLWNLIRQMKLPMIGQCIVYGVSTANSPGNFVHISIDLRQSPRKQFLWTPDESGCEGPYYGGVPK